MNDTLLSRIDAAFVKCHLCDAQHVTDATIAALDQARDLRPALEKCRKAALIEFANNVGAQLVGKTTRPAIAQAIVNAIAGPARAAERIGA